jgi:MFS family permease
MKSQITLFLGVFSIMALSNAIVPVLPAFAHESSWQGMIYAAYFLGAFLSTLPSGELSDRYGRVLLMRTGLILTVISCACLALADAALPALAARFMEGIGAGLFLPPALAFINQRADHGKMSGYFLALLNAGLVLGLLAAGLLATFLHQPVSGLVLFTVLAVIPAFTSMIVRESFVPAPARGQDWQAFLILVRKHCWIWYSSVILIGATGVVISLYPKFSGAGPDLVGIWIASMSIATIVSVLIISRFPLNPVDIIRLSAILMAAGLIASSLSPWGFLIIGAVAGIVMIAQMELLSRFREHQGIAMGLFSTMSYLGMAVLPFLAGLVADMQGFFIAFLLTALSAITVALAVRR